jgi:hypothetical protein
MNKNAYAGTGMIRYRTETGCRNVNAGIGIGLDADAQLRPPTPCLPVVIRKLKEDPEPCHLRP